MGFHPIVFVAGILKDWIKPMGLTISETDGGDDSDDANDNMNGERARLAKTISIAQTIGMNNGLAQTVAGTMG
ncbi:hypothetical protein FUA23_06010 [Neolewinella aurantiaca]|uniref:Uncharacterized protein n=1 Tax=Neolewinella aurantiaca TaxID=2602767 RepID=A0A5C7FHQ6_9BACT|nr:hypothetical protein [Neolewinella aurantiaca]TXF90647.1 hypothetical protein FUA23_06010 [Neolewinella aurantiaca]